MNIKIVKCVSLDQAGQLVVTYGKIEDGIPKGFKIEVIECVK